MTRMRPYLIFGLGFVAGALLIGGIAIYLTFKDLGENLTAGMNDAMGVHYGVIGAQDDVQELETLRMLTFRAFLHMPQDDMIAHLEGIGWSHEISPVDDTRLYTTTPDGTVLILTVDRGYMRGTQSTESTELLIGFLESVSSLETLNTIRAQITKTSNAYRDLVLSKLIGQPYDEVLAFLHDSGFQTTESVGPHNRVIYRYIAVHFPHNIGTRFVFEFDKLVWIGKPCDPYGTPEADCWSQN